MPVADLGVGIPDFPLVPVAVFASPGLDYRFRANIGRGRVVASAGADMAAYLIFDVEIHDMAEYGKFMAAVKPAVEGAGGRYLVRGGEHKVLEGEWRPTRLVLFEFPSMQAAEDFYNGPVYQGMRTIRLASSTAKALVLVEGV